MINYDANMSGVFFQEMGIPKPSFSLDIGSGSHAYQTGRMMMAIEDVCAEVRPDMVLVYGDTNSTIAAALVAAKQHIPLAHVEAGLRSFNKTMPEEINRIVTDRLSDILFAPTAAAVDNLLREGVDPALVHRTGDVMFDAALQFTAVAEKQSDIIERLGLANSRFALATIHRAANVDDEATLLRIARALSQLSVEIPVVLPLHPRTRARWRLETPAEFQIIEPVGFLDMCQLESRASLIVTDSGGVQKEAFFHKVPCVTLREETEWVELVEGGFNRLAPPGASADILAACRAALGSRPDFTGAAHLYGAGDSAQLIAAKIADWISTRAK